MLILGDRRVDKLRAYMKQFGIKLPSNEVIREKEDDLMLEYDISESTRKLFNTSLYRGSSPYATFGTWKRQI